MLTKKQIQKASRFINQVGEPRPGYIRDSDSGLKGPDNITAGRRSKKTSEKSKKRIRIKLVFEEDALTKEIRINRK